jgi:hypothetical protein
MHRVGRDGLDCYACGVREGDTVYFVFGEIDCRCHIHKQVNLGSNYEDVIEELMDSYFRIMLANAKGIRIIVVSIIPPVKYEDFLGANPPLDDSHPFPFVGSDETRVKITRDMNNGLEERCKKFGFDFLNIYDHYAREDGTLKFELSDGICHIADNAHVLSLVG